MCAAKPPKPKAPPKPPSERDSNIDGTLAKQERARRADMFGGYNSTLGGSETRTGSSPKLSGA